MMDAIIYRLEVQSSIALTANHNLISMKYQHHRYIDHDIDETQKAIEDTIFWMKFESKICNAALKGPNLNN